MAKRALFIVTCMFSSLILSAQGVKFQQLTLNEALAKAKSEKKLVFLDGYTTWCGPCKRMTEEEFPKKEAGDFFNKHFINVKFDMQEGEGVELKKRFNITAFPTFLILNSAGEVQYRLVGGGEIDEFIKRIERASNPKNSLDRLSKEYESGKMKKTRVKDYLLTLYDAREREKLEEISDKFIASLKERERYSKKYAPLFLNRLIFPKTPMNLTYIAAYAKEFKKSTSSEKVDSYLTSGYDNIIRRYISGSEKEICVLERIKEELNTLHLPKRDELLAKADLGLAVVNGEYEQALALIELNLSSFIDYAVPLFNIFSYLNTESKETMARVVALEEPLLNGNDIERVKRELRNMFGQYRALVSKGVYWFDNSLKEAQSIARKSGKMIFLNCYTSSCESSIEMNRDVFPREDVGDYINKHFISLEVDMDKELGREIGKLFDVVNFPTYLIIAPNGKEIYRVIGKSSAEDIIKAMGEGIKIRNN